MSPETKTDGRLASVYLTVSLALAGILWLNPPVTAMQHMLFPSLVLTAAALGGLGLYRLTHCLRAWRKG